MAHVWLTVANVGPQAWLNVCALPRMVSTLPPVAAHAAGLTADLCVAGAAGAVAGTAEVVVTPTAAGSVHWPVVGFAPQVPAKL